MVFHALTFARSRVRGGGGGWGVGGVGGGGAAGLETEAGCRGFQHLTRDLANVNALKTHVRSLLLHKNGKHLLHFALFLALFCFSFSPMSRERNFHGLCSF